MTTRRVIPEATGFFGGKTMIETREEVPPILSALSANLAKNPMIGAHYTERKPIDNEPAPVDDPEAVARQLRETADHLNINCRRILMNAADCLETMKAILDELCEGEETGEISPPWDDPPKP